MPIHRSPQSEIVLAICGPAQSGKDEAAQCLAACTELKYNHSTSYAALDYIYARMQNCGMHYPTKQACYDDRFNHRQLWADWIDEYNQPNPVRLYAEHLNRGSNFLVGIRKLLSSGLFMRTFRLSI